MPRIRRQERGAEPDAVGAQARAVANAWRANRNRADAGHDLAFRQMTVAHQPLAAFIGALLGVAPEERGHLGLDRLGQKGTGAVAQHLGQRIGKRRWLGKLQNVIVGHGVSLLCWRSGGSITPTIRHLNPSRRHQLLAIARRAAPIASHARTFPYIERVGSKPLERLQNIKHRRIVARSGKWSGPTPDEITGRDT